MAEMPDGIAVFFSSEDGKTVELKPKEIVCCRNCAYFDWNWCTHLEMYSKGPEWYCGDGKKETYED